MALYHQGDFFGLLKLMDSQQQLVYRQWAVAVTLRRIQKQFKLLQQHEQFANQPAFDAYRTQHQAFVRCIRNWLENPGAATEAAARQLLHTESLDQSQWATLIAIGDAIDQVAGAINRANAWATADDPGQIAVITDRAQCRAICVILRRGSK
jgi:hypothetical protein